MVAITVRPVNDAPVNTVPGTQTVDEDTALVFSSANGNTISIGDVDAGSNPVEVTLTASHGVLTLGGTTGLTFSAGDGATDGTMTFRGAILHQYGAKRAAVYARGRLQRCCRNHHHHQRPGQHRCRRSLSDTDTVALTVRPVNDAPVNTAPGSQTIAEDTALVFSSTNGNRNQHHGRGRRNHSSTTDADSHPRGLTLWAGWQA